MVGWYITRKAPIPRHPATLEDPCFVAQRCDLDSSGDLDVQELKQAALCFGMKLSNDQLRDLMKDGGAPRH